MDLTLVPADVGGDSPPFRFADTPSLIAALGALPVIAGSAIPVPNRLWLADVAFGSMNALTGGTIACDNTDIRGGDFVVNSRGQELLETPFTPVPPVVFEDAKRLVDLLIDAFPRSPGGLFSFPDGEQLYMENVTITGPANGFSGPSPVDVSGGNEVVLDRCVLNNPGLLVSPFSNPITLLNDNVLTVQSLQDGGAGGAVLLAVKGTGNFISPSAAAPGVTVDVDIGGQGTSPSFTSFSGADMLNFGGGSFVFPPGGLPAPDGALLRPGGGNPGDAACPTFLAPPATIGQTAKKAGVVRGLYLYAEAPVGPRPLTVDVDFYVGGALLFTEFGVFLTTAGTFVEVAFGFMTSGIGPFLPNLVQIVVRESAPAGTSWAAINTSWMIK